jgi:hypothetical protein
MVSEDDFHSFSLARISLLALESCYCTFFMSSGSEALTNNDSVLMVYSTYFFFFFFLEEGKLPSQAEQVVLCLFVIIRKKNCIFMQKLKYNSNISSKTISYRHCRRKNAPDRSVGDKSEGYRR